MEILSWPVLRAWGEKIWDSDGDCDSVRGSLDAIDLVAESIGRESTDMGPDQRGSPGLN